MIVLSICSNASRGLASKVHRNFNTKHFTLSLYLVISLYFDLLLKLGNVGRH